MIIMIYRSSHIQYKMQESCYITEEYEEYMISMGEGMLNTIGNIYSCWNTEIILS